MKWLEVLVGALREADPLVIFAVVVLAFLFALHSLFQKALATLERVARQRNKP